MLKIEIDFFGFGIFQKCRWSELKSVPDTFIFFVLDACLKRMFSTYGKFSIYS